MNAVKNNTCSKCGLFGELSAGNLSKKTGERLYRSWCVSCEKSRKAKWVQDNLEHVLEKTKKYQEAHPEIPKRAKEKWASNNKDRLRQTRKEWRNNNIQTARAHVSARRRKVRQNTPIWETHGALVEFYKNCPEGFHVDHVIPLRGKLVSGLHTISNLQYLPARENMTKSNKYGIE